MEILTRFIKQKKLPNKFESMNLRWLTTRDPLRFGTQFSFGTNLYQLYKDNKKPPDITSCGFSFCSYCSSAVSGVVNARRSSTGIYGEFRYSHFGSAEGQQPAFAFQAEFEATRLHEGQVISFCFTIAVHLVRAFRL